MKPVVPLENGGKVGHALKYVIASIHVMTPLAYLVYSLYVGQPVDSVLWLVVVGLVIVSAYVIFGKEDVDAALAQAEDLTGGGEE